MPIDSQLIYNQRQELDNLDADNLARLIDAYTLMYDRIDGDIDALILAAQLLGEQPTIAQVRAMPEYKKLLDRSRNELDRFTIYLETIIGTSALAAMALGLRHSEELIRQAGIGFNGIDSRAMAALLDYLAEGSPLYNRLQLITTASIDKIISAIVDGVASGFNPRKIAAMIRDAFGGGLTDALRNTRTVQLYAYRDAARANYMATDGIVTKWVWWAELDANVCMSCVAMHGTLHDLDERLNDHYNGRCAAIPYIPEIDTDPIRSGQEWFDSLTEAEQRRLMGPGKLDAYRSNQFDFSALSSEYDNDVYGTMRSETSLKQLLGQ